MRITSLLVALLLLTVEAQDFSDPTFVASLTQPAAAPGGGGIEFHAAAQSLDAGFNATASPTVIYPAVDAGDIILVALRSSDDHNSSGTPPTGFTKITEQDGPGGSMSVFWKRASGSETSEAWTDIFAATESGVALAVSYAGCLASGNVIDASLGETSSTSTAKDISQNTATANAMVVCFVGFDCAGAAYTVAWDGGITERVVDDSTPSGYSDARNVQITSGDILVASPGAQNMGLDLGTTTSAEEVWVALKPA